MCVCMCVCVFVCVCVCVFVCVCVCMCVWLLIARAPTNYVAPFFVHKLLMQQLLDTVI